MKKAAVPWDPWLDRLSEEAVREHWGRRPADDVGSIIGERQLVLDTDSPEATAALKELERRHCAPPLLIVETQRGEHHYFTLGEGVFIRSDSHDGKRHPERIDVKACRSMVNLPPSGVRKVKRCNISNASGLTEVDQGFVDAVFAHNGRSPPRPGAEREAPEVYAGGAHLAKVQALLHHISPNCGYDDWLRILMAIYHETQGSNAGLDLADGWSARGHDYPGRRDLERKWRSFSGDVAEPVTIGTLIKMAKDSGGDVAQIMDDAFATVETETIDPEGQGEGMPDEESTPLDRYSLQGRSELLLTALVANVYVLGALALLGQATFFFAAPGTGKTLITLFLLLKSLRLGRISGRKTYYFNMDDNPRNLIAKQELADEYGFHLIVEGYLGFKVGLLLELLDRMAQDGSAKNTIIILDTVEVCERYGQARLQLVHGHRPSVRHERGHRHWPRSHEQETRRERAVDLRWGNRHKRRRRLRLRYRSRRRARRHQRVRGDLQEH
jgi:hypothetical protein